MSSLREIHKQFRNKEVKKIYECIVHGRWPEDLKGGPITDECEIVSIPFRCNLGPELINKVLKQGNLEVVGIQEDGTWTMEIIARVIKDE